MLSSHIDIISIIVMHDGGDTVLIVFATRFHFRYDTDCVKYCTE